MSGKCFRGKKVLENCHFNLLYYCILAVFSSQVERSRDPRSLGSRYIPHIIIFKNAISSCTRTDGACIYHTTFVRCVCVVYACEPLSLNSRRRVMYSKTKNWLLNERRRTYIKICKNAIRTLRANIIRTPNTNGLHRHRRTYKWLLSYCRTISI